MLIATQGKSVSGTQQYFDQVLTQGDYYLGQEVSGQWHGRGTEILGLEKGTAVSKEQFCSLLNGRHPDTGKQLAQRNRKDRRPGMDLTFSVPKSVSLAWAINGDEKIINALRETVQESMSKDVEPLMQRRVRDGKHASTKQSAQTGKLIYADFLHKTSRPVDGKADPHLHVHAFVVNWTEQGGKHYAGEFHEIVRQRPSLQAKFEARLARRLQNELGYSVEHVRYAQSGRIKAGWEIKGIDRSTVEKFSRRTAQVENVAKEKGVIDAEKKGRLGKLTREKKDTGKSIDVLRSEWKGRLTATERAAFKRLNVKDGKSSGETDRDATASLKYAIDHHLYRQSTVERHQVVGTALEHGLTLTPELVDQRLDRMNLIHRTRDVAGTKQEIVTTREVLESEKQMIDFARDGRGTRKAIGDSKYEFNRDWLNDQQQSVVQHVLESRDTVVAVTGGAGTGKSSLMQEAADAIRSYGKEVFTFAPSTGAREVLEEKGFKSAQTVEHLLRNTELQSKTKDQVLWVDEAGLLDVRSMNGIFKVAKQQNARVVLSGDTRQHASPRRGEAMRLLETEAGLNIARVEAIQRQKGRYRKAVELISRGNDVVDQRTGKTGLLAGFDQLDRMGKIKEVPREQCGELLAKHYLRAVDKGKKTLVVAPTHAEGRAATQQIRDALRARGQLENNGKTFTQLCSLNLSTAEKGEPSTYAGQEGAIVQFHQNAKGGFKRGDRYRVDAAKDGSVEVSALDGKSRKSLPLGSPDRFEVYGQDKIEIAVGDKVRFSLGGTTKDRKTRISNGRLDEVRGFDRNNNLVLKSGAVVDRDYGHLDLGYVVTSHASQGKDRQVAIAAMGSDSLPAINAKQFYVTVSRGSENVMIFVDNKAKVRRAIERSGEQLSATELVRPAMQESTPSPTREAGAAGLAGRGQVAARSFRDRLIHWWRSRSGERSTSESIGRHRQAGRDHKTGIGPAIGNTFGSGPTPDLGRSR